MRETSRLEKFSTPNCGTSFPVIFKECGAIVPVLFCGHPFPRNFATKHTQHWFTIQQHPAVLYYISINELITIKKKFLFEIQITSPILASGTLWATRPIAGFLHVEECFAFFLEMVGTAKRGNTEAYKSDMQTRLKCKNVSCAFVSILHVSRACACVCVSRIMWVTACVLHSHLCMLHHWPPATVLGALLWSALYPVSSVLYPCPPEN